MVPIAFASSTVAARRYFVASDRKCEAEREDQADYAEQCRLKYAEWLAQRLGVFP